MAGTRRAVAVALSLVPLALLALLASCSLGAKTEQAERIVAAATALPDRGPLAGSVDIRVRFSGAGGPTASTVVGGVSPGGGAPAGPAIALALTLDARRHRSEFRISPASEALAVFSGTTVYARRSGTGTARPWAALDFDDLDRVEKPSLEATFSGSWTPNIGLVDPVAVVGLAAGTLTGSIERRGVEQVEGADAERFDVNFSVDKAESELDLTERDRDARRRMFRLVGTTDDVVPGSVWLEGDRLVRVEVRFPFRPAARIELTTAYRVTLAGATESPRVPGRGTVLVVDSTAELARGLAALIANPRN